MKNNSLKLLLLSFITFASAEASTRDDDNNPFERGTPGLNRGISPTTPSPEREEDVNDKKRKRIVNLVIEIPQNTFFSSNKSPTNPPSQKKKRKNPFSPSTSTVNNQEEEFHFTVKTPVLDFSFSMLSSPSQSLPLSPTSSSKIFSPLGMWRSYPDGTPFTPGFSPKSPLKSPVSLRKSVFRNIMKQAEEGNHQAQFECAQYFYNPDKTENPDFEKAAYWLKKSADQGNAIAAYELAELYEQGKIPGKDIHDAISYYEKGAQGNDVDSMFMLGRIHHLGREGTLEINIRKAIKWYKKAKKFNHALSTIYLGEIYLLDENIQNYKKSFKYLNSQNKDPIALFYLGQMYARGLGVPQNHSKAIECFHECLERNKNNDLRGDVISQLSDLFVYDDEKMMKPSQELSDQTFKTFSEHKEHIEGMLSKLIYRHGLETGQSRQNGWNDNLLFDNAKVSLLDQLLTFESKVQTVLSQMNKDGFLIDIVNPKFDERVQGPEVPYYEYFPTWSKSCFGQENVETARDLRKLLYGDPDTDVTFETAERVLRTILKIEKKTLSNLQAELNQDVVKFQTYLVEYERQQGLQSPKQTETTRDIILDRQWKQHVMPESSRKMSFEEFLKKAPFNIDEMKKKNAFLNKVIEEQKKKVETVQKELEYLPQIKSALNNIISDLAYQRNRSFIYENDFYKDLNQ